VLLGCRSNQNGGGIYCGVIEVDLFDEADSKLVVDMAEELSTGEILSSSIFSSS